MNDEEPENLPGSLRLLADETRRLQGPDAHPTPEALTAYHAGELVPDAEAEVQEHLAVCRHCARLLLDLPAFLAAPGEAAAAAGQPEAAETGADVAWQALRERLPRPPAEPARRPAGAPAPPAPPARRAGPRRALIQLAAAMLLAAVAVPLWIIARRLAAPELPAAMAELSPVEGDRGTTAAPPAPPAIVHADAAATFLYLHLAAEQPARRFRVELRAAGAITPLPVKLAIDPQTVGVVLARRQLVPGRYQLLVLDGEHPSAAPLGSYELQVVEP
jgi:hypothetical protein